MEGTNDCSSFLDMLVKLSSPDQSTLYKNLGETVNLEVQWKNQRFFQLGMGHSEPTSWCAITARLENAVVTSTADHILFAMFSKSTSTSEFVISISFGFSSPHFSGKSITLRVSIGGRLDKIHSLGIVAACRARFSAAISFQWFVTEAIVKCDTKVFFQVATSGFIYSWSPAGRSKSVSEV